LAHKFLLACVSAGGERALVRSIAKAVEQRLARGKAFRDG